MPTHLGGDCEQTPLLAKGSPFVASTDRKTSLLRDRPARRAVKRAYRIWVSDAAHHCVQLRIDLLFTMSDNLHRVIEDRRDTNSSSWTSSFPAARLRLPALARQPKLRSSEGWWSQTGSNRRPPACKAGALPAELWPRLRKPRFENGGPGKTRTSDLTLIKRAL
jgi:hypothetical protein